ncbi:hypothetical protein PQ469_23420 [Mucilaginibacter sp. KACC 22773]|uniref:hypothetical protein n=1 Tax=Mucilaginibacter sp. KACC 22773 TaxID=3025671 RepID=UPI00236710C4|nr:hypothetical protein [Mucilaginibacter sp. KACC 22773]WDF76837.1 hypothetical protein PQ469_23420 [Mucilaginibacter sp. KACC 22773]
MKRLRILTLISVLLAILVFFVKNKKPSTISAGDGLLVDKAWLTTNPQPLIPQKDVRPSDQTFLTFPEWFLVFSPAEQADYFKTNTSTTFPYMKHIDQMWGGYGIVYNQIKGNYPFNTGYHVMIMVIAGSTTVEYGIKSFYETIAGRITNTKQGEAMTGEDKFNAAYELNYVKFIEDLPWYEYDFNHQLKMLWGSTPLSGQHMFRKLERRYYLTTELLVKSGYGYLIKLATKSAYDVAALNTTVVVDKKPVTPDARNTKELSGDLWQTDLPRYARFNYAVQQLAASNINLTEIAGNKGSIMLTLLTPQSLKENPRDFKILFTQPIFTKPGLNRIAVVTTVNGLSKLVKILGENHVTIEHIYDY